MGLFRATGRAIKKPIVNFPKWLGFSYLWNSAKNISRINKNLFVPKKAVRMETFEEAVARLNLTEADLKKRTQQLLITTYLYSVITLALLALAVYLFINNDLAPSLLAVAVTILACVFIFREHFHYVQMKRRRLGGGFKAWLNYCLKRDIHHA